LVDDDKNWLRIIRHELKNPLGSLVDIIQLIKCDENLDKDVKTVEDLIKFSKHAKMLKRPKLDPLYKPEEDKESL